MSLPGRGEDSFLPSHVSTLALTTRLYRTCPAIGARARFSCLCLPHVRISQGIRTLVLRRQSVAVLFGRYSRKIVSARLYGRYSAEVARLGHLTDDRDPTTRGGILFRGRYSGQAYRGGRILLRGRYSDQRISGRVLLGGRYSGQGGIISLAGRDSTQHSGRVFLLGRNPNEHARRWRWWVRLFRGRYSVQTHGRRCAGSVLFGGRYPRNTRVLFHRDGSGKGTTTDVRHHRVLFSGRYPGEGAQIACRAARRHHRGGATEGHRSSFRVVAWRSFKRY